MFAQVLYSDCVLKVAEYATYGLQAVNVNSDTPNNPKLWQVNNAHIFRATYRRLTALTTSAYGMATTQF